MFYCTDIKDKIILEAEESRHCIKVLRKKVGDTIEVTDGKGRLFSYKITVADSRKCSLSFEKEIKRTSRKSCTVHIAISPTKNMDRMEWFVEKATELGVSHISLILCKHSERKVIKTDRLMKKAIAAIKQSGNLHLPVINELQSFESFVKTIDANTEKYIAYVLTASTELLFRKTTPNRPVIILIGPEGDFSTEEINMANAYKFDNVSLGEHVLRTETAGLAAIQHVILKNSLG